MEQTTATVPTVHITNYQQYIAPAILTQGIYDHLPQDENLPQHLHASIAYLQVVRFIGRYKTKLSLNIIGRTYSFTLLHDNAYYYNASKAIYLNDFGGTLQKPDYEKKDAIMRLFQQAFVDVVNKNIKQITKAITTAYGS